MKRSVVVALFVLWIALPVAFCCSVVVIPRQVARTFSIMLGYSGKPLQMQLSVFDTRTGRIVRQVTTDVDGRAEVQNLEPGTYRITSPVSEDAIEVTQNDGSNELHIAALFEREPVEVATVAGTITDPTGAIIPGAIVVLERTDTWHSPIAVGTADASGSISLRATEGVYLLRVASQGFQTAIVPLRIARTGWSAFALALQVGGSCGGSGVPFTIKPKQ